MSNSILLKSATDPFEIFHEWVVDAEGAGHIEPRAMTICTVGENGRPSARQVLFKSYGKTGLEFHTNYASRKARELTTYPYASAVIWWDRLERQVRVEGAVEKLSSQESDEYFATRPRGSQISAWASRQSHSICSIDSLRAKVSELENRFEDKIVSRPEFWGGFRLIAETIEFWQGQPNRLHERVLFKQVKAQWQTTLLAP